MVIIAPFIIKPNLTDSYYLDKIKASHHIHIYTEVAITKTPKQTGVSHRYFGTRESGTTSTSGGQTLSTIGLPGGCCLILSTQNFKMTSPPGGNFWPGSSTEFIFTCVAHFNCSNVRQQSRQTLEIVTELTSGTKYFATSTHTAHRRYVV